MQEKSDEKSILIPSGWFERIHPATKQTYYVHELSGQKRWTIPTDSTSSSDIIDKQIEVKFIFLTY